MTTSLPARFRAEHPPAESADAVAHFQASLRFEADCWDVHEELATSEPTFVLLDVRGPAGFAVGHVPGARNLPHGRINGRNLAEFDQDTLFVVYCSGPHCNGADRAALKLARLGRSIKKMIAGIEGWKDEGFTLERA